MTQPTSPPNHFAIGTIDNHGEGYLLLQPLNPLDGRLSPVALPIASGGLAAAEQYAERFNRGELWAFRGGALRDGDIPELHRSPGNWKVATLPYGSDYTPLQLTVADMHLVDTALRGGVSRKYALFLRSQEHDRHTLLLSPEASVFAQRLSADWVNVETPPPGDWVLLYGDADAHTELGVERPKRLT